MTFICPGCQRTFDEAGFCPFDRVALISTAGLDKATLLSAAVPIQAPHKTDLQQRKETFPMSRSEPSRPVAALPADRATAASSAVKPPLSGSISSVSASSNPSAVLDAYGTPRASEYDRLVGQTLDGRYYVERKLGEGGMGVVFAARHAVIERPLAIKVLKREVMRDTATIRRFVQEAKAASRIGHPNIVDVTDFGTTPDGMTYSVMEYVDGMTLAAAIRHGAPFSLPRAVRIAAQIARALGAAHDKGIVHRDLKPDNIFLVDRDDRTDFVKIVDFGIARVTPVDGSAEGPRLTRAGSVFGTPEYMAPEQAAGRSDSDGRVDVYALGIILYEMVTGRVPHKGDSMVRTLAMQMLDPAEPLSRVRPDLEFPPAFEAIVARALTKKREQRYQTMGELLAALEKFTKESLPAPVGTSVTGSPVYALSPLPPGADPALGSASPGAMHRVAMSPSEVPTPLRDATPPPSQPPGPGPRAHSPSQAGRPRHEPEFVTSSPPRSFEHVWTDEYQPPPRRKWPLVLLGAMIVGGAAGAVAVMLKSRANVEHRATNVGERRDGGEVVAVPLDASAVVVAEVPADAGAAPADAAPPADATAVALITPRDAAAADAARVAIISDRPRDPHDGLHPIDRHPRDPGTGPVTHPGEPGQPDRPPRHLDTPNGRGTYMIQVLTKPEGANLYRGTTFRGPGGVSIEENPGTAYEVECRMAGYKPGHVELRWDGKTEVALCVMERIKRCVDNLKNPFDKCDETP